MTEAQTSRKDANVLRRLGDGWTIVKSDQFVRHQTYENEKATFTLTRSEGGWVCRVDRTFNNGNTVMGAGFFKSLKEFLEAHNGKRI